MYSVNSAKEYFPILLSCCWIYIALCMCTPSLVILGWSFLYDDSTGSIASTGNDYMMVDLCSDKQFLVSHSKQCTVTNSLKSNTCNITMVTANCEDIHLQTENIHNISKYEWYGVTWLPLHAYLYIINNETATVTYNITIEPAEPNTTIQGRVLVFDNEEYYFRSQQEPNDAGYIYINEVMVTQLTQLVTVTFPRNRTIYFIALQIEKGTIDQVSVTSTLQKSYYSVNGLANKTCLDSTECMISFGKEECTLVKTSSITELDIKAEKHRGLFWTLLSVEIICVCCCSFWFWCIFLTIFLMKKKKQQRRRADGNLLSTTHDQEKTTGDNTIDHITQVLVQISCLNCYQFGRALNLSDSEISHIATKCGKNEQESMRAILLKWSLKSNNVSWRAVVQALRYSDQPQLADMITMCYIEEGMDITESIPPQVTSISLNDPPTMKMLLENVATKIATKWESFGIMVELESEDIRIIKSEQTKEVLRMMEVFRLWQRNNRPPFTWNTVIETLRTDALREKTLAQTLIHDLITDATSTAL